MKLSYWLVALLFFLQASNSAFTYLFSSNGTLPSDPDSFYAFARPTSLALSEDILFVSDPSKRALYLLNASSNLSRIKAVFSPSGEYLLEDSAYMDFDYGSKTLFIAGGISGDILYYSGEGSLVSKWNPFYTNLKKASDVLVLGDMLYVADSDRGEILAFSKSTRSYSHVAVRKGDSDGLLQSPRAIGLHDEKIYVSDSGKGEILVYDKNFSFLHVIGRGKGGVTLSSPRGFCFQQGILYVADASSGKVIAFWQDGFPIGVLDLSSLAGGLSSPEDVACKDGLLYVADSQDKAVKAFSINSTAENFAVLNNISEANATCSVLGQLYSAASMLSLNFTPIDYSSSIKSALDYYEIREYSSAFSIASNTKSSCRAQQISLEQSINFTIQNLIWQAKNKTSAYRNLSSANLSLISEFDKKAASAMSALLSKNYSLSAELALQLSAMADGIAYERPKAPSGEQTPSKDADFLSAKAAELSDRIAKIEEKSKNYRQNISLSYSKKLIALALKSIENSNLDSASHSIELASFEVESQEALLNEKCRQIDSALSEIAIFESSLSSFEGKQALFRPDFSSERLVLAQAKDLAYSNPSLSLQLISKAKDSAEIKAREANALSLAALALIIMFSVIFFGFTFIFMHIRHKRKNRK